jgi:hypothetical protein
MGGIFSIYGGNEKWIKNIGSKTSMEENTWGDVCMSGRIISKWILKKQIRLL